MKTLNIQIIQSANRNSSANYSWSFDLPTGLGTVIGRNCKDELEAERRARAAVRSLECTRDYTLTFDFVKAALMRAA